MGQPLLVVLAGRPGTGKTSLGRLIAVVLGAAFVRIDAIETALVRCGGTTHPVGPAGYVVAQEIATATLALGTSVVIDAVNPVPEARAGWGQLTSSARLVVFETIVPAEAEHRRRVSERIPDLVGQTVPTWEQVLASDYVLWDETRDGPRTVIDMTDTQTGAAAALHYLRDTSSI